MIKPSILLATASLFALSAMALAPAHAQATADPVGNAALQALKSLQADPAAARKRFRRDDAYLTTGSVIRSNGRERVFYHLPAAHGDLTLRGESDARRWPVYLARQQLQGEVSLRIAYRNAVSVMPEASRLVVSVNGTRIGQAAIQSPGRPRTLVLKVPSHILVPGFNEVHVAVRQRHRVDCSVRATHELWTQIEAAETGFVFSAGNSALSTLDSIAALARNKAGQVRMRLLVPETRTPEQVAGVMAMAQHAAISAHFDSPHVEVASERGTGAGLDLFAGTLEELQAIAPRYAAAIRPGNALQIVSRDADERLALILLRDASSSAEMFTARLATVFPKAAPRGSKRGVAAWKAARQSFAARPQMTFHRLGLEGGKFDGRLYRRSFPVNLPSDYFSADYDQAQLDLKMAYAGGLDRSNKFIIRVNGVTATGFSLSQRNGHVFENKMMRLPLSAFRPGRNEIEIEAQLARADERECDPRKQISDKPRFELSGTSTISFPRLAHMARLPDLGGTVSSGFPYVIGGKAQPTSVAIAEPGYQELSAAASFATQIAVRAGRPLSFDVSYGAPANDAQNAIVVGSFSTLPAEIARGIKGIDSDGFELAWGAAAMQTLAGAGGIDPLTTAGIGDSSSSARDYRAHVAVAAPQDTPDPLMPLESWDDPLDDGPREDDRLGFSAQLWKLVSSSFALKDGTPGDVVRIDNPQADILVSQRLAPDNENGVWTVLTARDRDALKSGASLLGRPEIADRVSGETIAVNGIDNTVTSAITAQRFVQVRGFSLRNAHLIVAGWFSNNHHLYSLLFILTLLAGGLASNRLLRIAGAGQHGTAGKQNDD